jgi:nitrogen fixation protein FixH
MAKTTALSSDAPLTGRKVLIILLASFGAVFGVNGLMAYDAVSTFRGEVVDHPYEAGLAYNSQIAAAEAQTERHWKVDVTLAGGGVRATFRDAEGQPIKGLTVTGAFASPADMKRDRRFAMSEKENGAYVGEAPPPAGIWDLKLKAARGGETLFQSKNRVTLR